MTFTKTDDLGLTIDLAILDRGTQRKNILLNQHDGTFIIDNTRAGNANQVDAASQLSAFFVKASEIDADLVVTPEYSCPWQTIRDLISNNNLPRERKLWVIGCESMTKQELRDLDFTSDSIHVIYDRSVLENTMNYVDPLLYIFHARHENKSKIILLIQFKCHHMGVWGGAEIERNNLIEGREIYILRNGADSIHLFSLICSEAMSFEQNLSQQQRTDILWHDMPYLVLNPQLNPNPYHPNFTLFRKFISSADKKEIISLNWSNNTLYNNNKLMEFNASRSGLNIKSTEIDFSSRKLRHNHKFGMYYFYLSLNKHTFIINSSIDVIHFATSPVSIRNGIPQQNRHDGPEVTRIFKWNDEKTRLIEVESISDGHIEYLTELGCENQFLINADNCILEKERLVTLSAGKIYKGGLKHLWSDIFNLYSVQSIEETEINRRISVAGDAIVDNSNQRKAYVDAILELETVILPDVANYPDSISHLKGDDLVVGYVAASSKDNYRYNITTRAGDKRIATICYLGSAQDAEINKAFDLIQGLFENDSSGRKCVVVYYRRGTNIGIKYDPTAGRISSVNDFSSPSFLK